MKDVSPYPSTKATQRAAYFTIISAGIIVLMIYARSLLIPMVAGAFLAMLLVPVVNRLDKIGIPRVLSIFITLLITIFSLGGLLWFFAGQISGFSEDLSGIEQQFNGFVKDISTFLSDNLGMHDLLTFNTINSKLFVFLKENASKISTAAFSTLGSLGLVVLVPVYLFMFLLYRHHFTDFAVKLFKNQPENEVKNVVADLRRVIQNYISGVLKVMVILAILNIIALSTLGIKHAFFFGIFAAMMNIIPYVGPLIGNLLPMLFALLTKDSLWYPLGVFISFTVIQSIEGNYLTPKIVGSNVNINPIISLIALLIGSMLWGVVGMILFIPMTAIIKKLLELHPSTAVYGYLMGEELDENPKEQKKFRIPGFLKKRLD